MGSNKEKGQVLLLVVLVMVVSLTVGLSVASRSVVNVRTSSEEVDTQKALAAAEAGIEQILQSTDITPRSGELLETTNFTTSVTEVGGLDSADEPFILNGGSLVLSGGDGIDVWLVDHNNENGDPEYNSSWSGTLLSIYWGNSNVDCSNAAVEIAVIEQESALTPPFKLTRYAYDPCNDRITPVITGNNFDRVVNNEVDIEIKGMHLVLKDRISSLITKNVDGI